MPSSSLPPTRVDDPPRPVPGAIADDCAALAAWLQRTREAERQALAAELHDELGAILTAARLDVAWLAAQPGCQAPEVAARLDSLSRVLAEGVGLKRRIVEDLHPTALTHLGLAAALEQLVAGHRARAGLELALEIDDRVVPVGEPALALYRIVQESLTNIQRHADARRVRISLDRALGRAVLTICDDGRGFDPAAVAGGHHGLIGMRQRMCALRGRFEVSSAPGRGTTVRASLPLPVSGAPHAHRRPHRKRPDRAIPDAVVDDTRVNGAIEARMAEDGRVAGTAIGDETPTGVAQRMRSARSPVQSARAAGPSGPPIG